MKQTSALTAKLVRKAKANGLLDKLYNQEVNRLIRIKYTESEELAIHRHYMLGNGSAEFAVYNAFCEECKTKAKATIDRLLNG